MIKSKTGASYLSNGIAPSDKCAEFHHRKIIF